MKRAYAKTFMGQLAWVAVICASVFALMYFASTRMYGSVSAAVMAARGEVVAVDSLEQSIGTVIRGGKKQVKFKLQNSTTARIARRTADLSRAGEQEAARIVVVLP